MADEKNEKVEETTENASEQAAEEPEAPTAEAEEAAAEAEPAAEPEPGAEAEAEPEPEVEAEPEAPQPEAEAPAAEAPAPPRKKKRLPRSLRRQRTNPVREKPKKRKPIVRLPRPEQVRGRRQERQGTVVSAATDKTIVVRVDTVKVHPRYKKVIRRSTKLHAHDERNEAKIGDVVEIVETRPVSKLKRWRLQRVVEAAK